MIPLSAKQISLDSPFKLLVSLARPGIGSHLSTTIYLQRNKLLTTGHIFCLRLRAQDSFPICVRIIRIWLALLRTTCLLGFCPVYVHIHHQFWFPALAVYLRMLAMLRVRMSLSLARLLLEALPSTFFTPRTSLKESSIIHLFCICKYTVHTHIYCTCIIYTCIHTNTIYRYGTYIFIVDIYIKYIHLHL